MNDKKIIVFDLDDTLYNEVDFLKSAFIEISSIVTSNSDVESITVYNSMLNYFYNGENVFEAIINDYKCLLSIKELLNIYRNHKPNIKLSDDRINVLNQLKSNSNIAGLGLLTDGRSIQQRNKIKALGLSTWISEIVISEEFGSEKPNMNNYKYFERALGEAHYYYVGDNIKKDFVTPNQLNWTTICLVDNGSNIHKQDKTLVTKEYLAKHTIIEFSDLLRIID
ncbi:HAD family hydrolase [Flavivirga aquimarina]|uniref:HAD family hydrolase n=1 Tax=Flavivirga aquimarina TaxID=2027862 RepID=A0ABT8WDV0_9FLAO|nr:HAD family hydrolase [Flavivirga aquimarina]MDO5971187.1 HAD family hydrolase [Flavivirga aquimarina]